jgi:hypothetical protein
MKHPQKRGSDFMDELDARNQALTPEQMLDTSEEDARTKENFEFADSLHQAALARGDKDAIELERLSKEARQQVADRMRQTSEDESHWTTPACWHISSPYISRHPIINTDRILPLKRFLISIVLLLVCLSFSSLQANGQEDRYWGTIMRNPPANYVLRMDDGKILNAEWESGYDRWSIGERIILTTEDGSGVMFFNKRRTRVAVFPYNPSQIGE